MLKVVGLCDFQVKPRLFEKRRGLVKRLKPLLKDKKGLGLLVKISLGKEGLGLLVKIVKLA